MRPSGTTTWSASWPGRREASVAEDRASQHGITTRHYAIDPETLPLQHTNAGLTAGAIRALERAGLFLRSIAWRAAVDRRSADAGTRRHGAGELGLPVCEVVSTAGVCVAAMTALQ